MVKPKRCMKKTSDWVITMLHTKFDEICDLHKAFSKNEKNVFCVQCNRVCCLHCVTFPYHHSHFQLQIYKYADHDVVRHRDIEKHVDCSKIQKFKKNGEEVLHLNARHQPNGFKLSIKSKFVSFCETCGRALQDQKNCFCSIACKIAVDSRIDGDHVHEPILVAHQECDRLSLKKKNDTTKSAANIQSHSKRLRRRKGFPRRSPLF